MFLYVYKLAFFFKIPSCRDYSATTEENSFLIAEETDDYRIVGGKVSERNEWPWIVSLKIKSSNGDFTCAGTIISATHVLTAAHCIYDVRYVYSLLI